MPCHDSEAMLLFGKRPDESEDNSIDYQLKLGNNKIRPKNNDKCLSVP